MRRTISDLSGHDAVGHAAYDPFGPNRVSRALWALNKEGSLNSGVANNLR